MPEAKLAQLRQQIEAFTWLAIEDDKGSYHATLTEAPFTDWRLYAVVSKDKWDGGAFDYWIIPPPNDPNLSRLVGGHGIMKRDDVETEILQRLIDMKYAWAGNS